VEYAEPDLERMARRVRRVVSAFRLVFYPGAVLLVLVLLPLALGGGAPRQTTWLDGTTSQDKYFQLRIDPDGRLGGLGTAFNTRCGGMPWTPQVVTWRPRGPFVLHDGTLTIRESKTHRYLDYTWHRTATLHARVTDDSVRGTMDLVERLVDRPEYGAYYACESGPVSVSATAD